MRLNAADRLGGAGFQPAITSPVNRRGARLRSAFTIVELLVVIGIIIIVIAFAVPAFNSMARQAHFSQARATLSGAFQRAHILSISDRAMTAVRVFPADWEYSNAEDAAISRNRQRVALYQYRATDAANPDEPEDVAFDERLERIESEPTKLLPTDIWAAPTVAMRESQRADELLQGQISRFTFDPAEATGTGGFLNADDFLIVFGADGAGVQSDPRWQRTDPISWGNSWMDRSTTQARFSQPRMYRLKGYVPEDASYTEYRGQEVDGDRAGGGNNGLMDNPQDEPFRRFGFDGLVLYEREAFSTLGATAAPNERRAAILRSGRPYYISRIGGGLIEGAAAVEETENN
ncbi:MAG: hypothetical protein KDA32_14145 [Phycisphaerales bacterium]|nr:hypothetical protein [Phycisphaerales bacterium]